MQRKISDDIITLQVKFFTIGRFDMNKELQNPAAIDFMKVCENLHDGIHVSDGEGRILYVNKGYTRTTGIEAKDIIGRTVAEIEKEGKLYKGSVTERVLQTRERVDSVATIFKLDKEVLVTGIPIFDDDGEVEMVIVNSRDVTDLNTLRFSTNPYNIDRLAMAAGTASLENDRINIAHCEEIMKNREYTCGELAKMGFEMTDSTANFIFVRHPEIEGGELFAELRKRGVIVRHFTKERISDYNRISIGSREQMDILLREVRDILDGKRR